MRKTHGWPTRYTLLVAVGLLCGWYGYGKLQNMSLYGIGDQRFQGGWYLASIAISLTASLLGAVMDLIKRPKVSRF